MYRIFVILTLTLGPFLGFADCHVILAGPEIYQLQRDREGGTYQVGRIDGIRVTFERIKCDSWYGAIDYLGAHGRLKGETATGKPLRSQLTDQTVEVRLGFTFQQNTCGSPFITPFGGWGRFREKNHFQPPSPLPCQFTDTFNYIAVGFLSGVNFQSLLSMGINFKLMFMCDAQSKVADDPLFDDVTLMIKDEMNIRLDIPFTYTSCQTWLRTAFLLSPFFEFRHFGGREGFPFNFKDTKFYLYGARFALTYRF